MYHRVCTSAVLNGYRTLYIALPVAAPSISLWTDRRAFRAVVAQSFLSFAPFMPGTILRKRDDSECFFVFCSDAEEDRARASPSGCAFLAAVVAIGQARFGLRPAVRGSRQRAAVLRCAQHAYTSFRVVDTTPFPLHLALHSGPLSSSSTACCHCGCLHRGSTCLCPTRWHYARHCRPYGHTCRRAGRLCVYLTRRRQSSIDDHNDDDRRVTWLGAFPLGVRHQGRKAWEGDRENHSSSEAREDLT